MKFLSSITILFFAVVLLSCQSGVSAPEKEDYSKLEGLVAQIEVQMQALRTELEQITDYNEYLLQNRDSILASPSPFKYTMEGAFSTNLPGQDASLSTVVILNSSSDRKKAEELILLTNSMDSVFANFIKRYPKAVQIYSNSELLASRIYPAFDAKNIVDPSLDTRDFNFYYEADLVHNPTKKTVWIPDPYVDPAGKGWIFSLVHPVYDGEELSSVVGIDLSIGDVIDTYLDAVEGYFVLVNGNGDIIGGKSEAIELLGMPLLKNHVYRETIQMDNFRGADFNLSRSKNGEVRQMAKSILVDKNKHFDFVQDARMSLVLGHAFSQVDWYLLEIKLPN
jgi:hypothetical protein